MTPRRIMLIVLGGLAFVGAILLLVFRQARLAGLLRAAANSALIKHDLKELKLKRADVLEQDVSHSSKVMDLNNRIKAKEIEAIATPERLKGKTEEEIDDALRAAGLL